MGRADDRLESGEWIAQRARERLASRAGDGLHFRFDLDPGVAVPFDEALSGACARLFDFVGATAAADAHVDGTLVRPGQRVHAATAASLSVRWQVVGDSRSSEGVAPIRAGVGEARALARTPAVAGLARAFERAGWSFALVATADGRELWARAHRD